VLNRFENAISNRSRDGDATWNDLPTVIENTAVPGPINSPTAQVPNRPMLAAGRTNALLVNQASAGGGSTVAVSLQFGPRGAVDPRTVVPVPDGSALLNEGVRNGPDWKSVTPARSHPPTIASSPLPTSPATARPRPIGSSRMNMLTNR